MGLVEKDKMFLGLVALWFVCMVVSCATLSHAEGLMTLSLEETSIEAKIGDAIILQAILIDGESAGISGASVEACCDGSSYAFTDEGDGHYTLSFDTGDLVYSGDYVLTINAEAEGYGETDASVELLLNPVSDQLMSAALFGGAIIAALGFMFWAKSRN